MILHQVVPMPKYPHHEFVPVDAETSTGREAEEVRRYGSVEDQLADALQRIASRIPGSVVEFVPRPVPADEPLPANAAGRVLTMQLHESVKQALIAEAIAEAAYSADMKDLTREEKATALYLASHALRSTKRPWKDEAEKRAKAEGMRCLREECGAAFRGLSDAEAEQIAALMWSRQRAAYMGITEGTRHLTSGEYLRIVNGDRK